MWCFSGQIWISAILNLLELSLEMFLVISSEFTYVLQWNLSNPDTNGAEESVIVSEVSSFQRLKCVKEWYLGWEKMSRGGVLIEGCKIQSNHRCIPAELYILWTATLTGYSRYG